MQTFKKTLTIVYLLFILDSCSLKADKPSDFTIAKPDTVISKDEFLAAKKKLEALSQKENQRNAAASKLKIKQRYFRDNWFKFIKVVTTTANIDKSFGGITNLTCTISNTSQFNIDKIDMVVYYYKVSGQIYKEEHVIIEDLASEEIRTFKAPDSNRGVEYQNFIFSIKSKEAEFCFDKMSVGTATAGIDDLFYCK